VERRRLSVYFLYLAWRLWKSVVTLTVTVGILFPVGWFRSQSVPVFQWHRLLFTRSRWDIRWLSGRGKTPTFCVFPVFSAAVMEKCCDAYGDFAVGILFPVGLFGVRLFQCYQWHRMLVNRKSVGHTVGERSWKDADFLRISCI
jgi:hypothetical protein